MISRYALMMLGMIALLPIIGWLQPQACVARDSAIFILAGMLPIAWLLFFAYLSLKWAGLWVR
jgi:hypothetical protein